MEIDMPFFGIIGGTGRMGSWFAGLLEERGCRVVKASRRTTPSPEEVAITCDVVVVSVPMADTVPVIQRLAPRIPKGRLLMDLTSVKRAPMEAMLTYATCEVIGGHPLFGPDPDVSMPLRMALCPGRGTRWLSWLEPFLTEAGISCVRLDPHEHDGIMGLVQGLNHFLTLSLAGVLMESGFTVHTLRSLSTQNFEKRLEPIESLLGQPATLFEGLLFENPETMNAIAPLLVQASRLKTLIRQGNRQAFRNFFQSLKDYVESQKENTISEEPS